MSCPLRIVANPSAFFVDLVECRYREGRELRDELGEQKIRKNKVQANLQQT